MKFVDFRSDTVTRPTAAMRRAMAEAEVGDDVYGEDPTVNRLEERAAVVFGKEAALFVPTGTMGNTIGLKIHTEHGQEIVCEARAHILNYELSMAAWFAGCLVRPIESPMGILEWSQIREQIRPVGPHAAPTGLIEIENTHNMAGGTCYPQNTIDEICAGAHAMGLPVHMDGARIFNAAHATGSTVARITRDVDTVMFCLSKALGAPAGSMLVGSRRLIDKGRLYRKRLGGGMRQAGVLAAAGLIALEQMPARLGEDHENAKWLASEMATIKGIAVESEPQTNIVFFDVTATGLTAPEFSERLQERGVLMNANNARRVRFLTHYDVDRAACVTALAAVRDTAQR
ncbi:MAG: aminotransferase class I/II-fold pyridoxal phosphate-dependent enzyme [Acidobacteria bacterium]|nr:aminotransferase class I/II-fold pyridoxal phosphate-dependent enzyme [Acidobacteriota bacterium]